MAMSAKNILLVIVIIGIPVSSRLQRRICRSFLNKVKHARRAIAAGECVESKHMNHDLFLLQIPILIHFLMLLMFECLCGKQNVSKTIDGFLDGCMTGEHGNAAGIACMLAERLHWENNNMPREAYNSHGARFGSGGWRGFISSYLVGSDNTRKYLVHGHHHGDSDPNTGFKNFEMWVQ